MNRVLLRTNQQNVSEDDIRYLNQKIYLGKELDVKKKSFFQFHMERNGIIVQDHPDWFDGGDGYWIFAFQTEQSMRLMSGLKSYFRDFIKDERIHVYIQNETKDQYYQLVSKDEEFAELECGYSFKRKQRHYDKLKEDIKNMEEYFNHDDYESFTGGDELPYPLFHTKIVRKQIIEDECFGYGCDEDNPPVIHSREIDIHPEDEHRLKQYSFFVNHFNYKKSLLLGSRKIFDVLSQWDETVEKGYQYDSPRIWEGMSHGLKYKTMEVK